MSEVILVILFVSLYIGQAAFWYYAGVNKGSASAIETMMKVVGDALEHK